MIRPILRRLGDRAEPYFRSLTPWTNTYGLARSVMALATFLTLAINKTTLLFRPEAGSPSPVTCPAIAKSVSLFCALPISLDVARVVACMLLLPVIIGILPRYTGLLHWWVSYSFYASAKVTDGGEQVAAVLTLLLLPLTFSDGRLWHWTVSTSTKTNLRKLIGCFAALAVQVQVTFIYLDAGIEKLRVPEWQDGTNMFYILSNNFFGAPSYLRPVLNPVITSPAIAAITWSVLVLEFFLGINLVLPKTARIWLLRFAIVFHVLIALTMGIASFSMIMTGALLLGIAPVGVQLRQLFVPRLAIPDHDFVTESPRTEKSLAG